MTLLCDQALFPLLPLHTTLLPFQTKKNQYLRKSFPLFNIQASMEPKTAVVVGAGPAGCLMSHYLFQRGFNVQVFERHPPIQSSFPADDDEDERLYAPGDTRSYPLVITPRAIKAIEGAGLKLPPSLLKPLVGSCTHISKGKKLRFNYSERSDLESYSVSRNALVSFFQQSISQRNSDNLTLKYGWELSELSNDKTKAYFCRSKTTGEKMEVQFDLLIGADGVSSKVRSELMRLDTLHNKPSPLTMEYTKHPLSYKSFYIRPSLARASPLFEDQDRVQSWLQLNMLLVNVADGSFWGGSQNQRVVQSTSSSEVESLFQEHAPEVHELVVKENPNFFEDFVKQPLIPSGGAVILSRFHDNNIVLIGDSAHAMFPSYGTGCNAALEDCKLFNNILKDIETSDDTSMAPILRATSEFTKTRIADAHAIVEMNSNLMLFNRGRLGMLQKIFYKTLQAWFPRFVGLTAYQLLWLEVPFTKIKKRKQFENAVFYAFLAISSCALVLISLLVVKRIP